ncbi:MAG TPA: molybdopterin-dependent oxidoreductase [Albitalea sp.]
MSPHDSTGANLIVQVRQAKVMRVVPMENEDVNECWLADRDRFSYEALNGDQRLTAPMIKHGGEWKTVDWTTALEYVTRGLAHVKRDHGAASIGALASAHSTVEELHLLARLVRGLGSQNIDFRTRHADFAPPAGARWLGTSIASLTNLQRVLVVGSFLRKDHPLFAQRLRQAAKRGAQIHSLNAVHDDWALPLAGTITAAPSQWLRSLAAVAAAVAAAKGVAAPVDARSTPEAQRVAESLLSGERKAVLLGNAAAQHPQAGALLSLANWIGEQTGASVGYLGEAANTVGAQLVDALPGEGGLNAAQMLAGKLKAAILLNLEPAFDTADPGVAIAGLRKAETVIVLTPFRDVALDVADVLLPIAPFSETSGTFVNAEGRVQSFHGVVRPLGEARPAWKVLRVLGNMLGLEGFEHESAEEVRQEALPADVASRLSNRSSAPVALVPESQDLERIADVPIYCTDSLVRRAASLQLTADAAPPVVRLSQAVWQRLGLTNGAKVRVLQGGAEAVLPARLDPTLAPNAVRVPAGHPDTASLGAMFGPISVAKA